MKIGFDLDRVFINYPPFVPYFLIDWLYKNQNSQELAYRFPKSPFEQLIRQLSHLAVFRPQIKNNVQFINNFPNPSENQLYLISSRYKFLKSLTYRLLKKYNLLKPFFSINLNDHDEQPHLFKERLIKAKKIDLYVDDDLDLLKYLSKHCAKTKFVWYNLTDYHPKLEKIIEINNLTQITYFLK